MRDNKTGRFTKKTEDEIKAIFKIKYPKFSYVGGYQGIDNYFLLKCNDCGFEFNRHANILRPSNNKQIQCKKCNERLKNERIAKKNKERQEAKFLREKMKIEIKHKKIKDRSITKTCIICGEQFTTTKSNKKCCSSNCSKKNSNRKKDKRIYKNGVVDTSITLEKLIKRDKNICHICEQACNIKDYYYDNKGTFIAGNNYPSIDHVIPIAKGGKHLWNNVKLAHRRCNTLKRDNTSI